MSRPHQLLSGRLLARNVVWNLAGAGLPLVAALFAIPVLIDRMGTERFGLLMIVWMGVGYFSLFDLGIGRALTKLVAERLGDGRKAEMPKLIATALRLMLVLGTFAALIVFAAGPWLAGRVFNVPESLMGEAVWSFRILAITLPFVISTAGLIGILQAHQRFGAINAVQVPLGLVNFLGPVLVVVFTPSLVATTLVLAGARVLASLAYRRLCRPYMGTDESHTAVDPRALRELLGFGGWITVSNIVSPLMVYFDRFLIGALLTMTAVAYYTTPYEVVTRLWVVPDALVAVVFPALTTAMSADPIRARRIFSMAARILLWAMVPPVAAIVLFAPEGLSLWVGSDFAEKSTLVARWLVVGVFVNCMARLPFVTLQGYGRPDLTAKLHLVELPMYVVAIWALVQAFGIAGAAAAWTLRIVLDTVALFALVAWQAPELRSEALSAVSLTAVVALGLAGLALPQDLPLKVVCVTAVIVLCVGLALREIRTILKSKGAVVLTMS